MYTAEARHPVATGAVVAGVVVAPVGGAARPAVHRLVAEIGGEPVLGGDREHRTEPRMPRRDDRPGRPRLVDRDGLSGDGVDRWTACLRVQRQVVRAASGRLPDGERL